MSPGPFEDLGREQVVTFSCPACDTHHNRDEYVEADQVRIKGALHRRYKCPNGKLVILKMSVAIADGEPLYIELDPVDA